MPGYTDALLELFEMHASAGTETANDSSLVGSNQFLTSSPAIDLLETPQRLNEFLRKYSTKAGSALNSVDNEGEAGQTSNDTDILDTIEADFLGGESKKRGSWTESGSKTKSAKKAAWDWDNDDEIFDKELDDTEFDTDDDEDDDNEEDLNEILETVQKLSASRPHAEAKKTVGLNYTRDWLRGQLDAGLDTIDVIANGICEAIRSSKSASGGGDDELQSNLLDLLGFDKFDLIAEVFAHKDDVLAGLSVVDSGEGSSKEEENKSKKLPELSPVFFLQQELESLESMKSSLYGGNDDSAVLNDSSRIVMSTSNVLIQTKESIEREKALRKQNKKKAKIFKEGHEQAVRIAMEMGYDLETIKATLQKALDISKSKKDLEEISKRVRSDMGLDGTPSSFGSSIPKNLPNVYMGATNDKYVDPSTVLSTYSTRFVLPEGSIREDDREKECITIPCPPPARKREHERPIPIVELDAVAQKAFPGYDSLNRMQSIVFKTAYGSNENMLVCAPTGAGKTDVAMLSIMHCVMQNLDSRNRVQTDDFKIIYVAPMKALAAEIVRKFSKRLTSSLGIVVRELTGDMQLTRAEIRSTQIIVTTPEKWDVITRKSSSTDDLVSKVRLLIIDEVHLLDEDRGAVIETIVARTQRFVEVSQSMIRIVGLSATLPNYLDVAEFLSVNIYSGLFVFDSSFRPVPLEQHFIGVKGKGAIQTQRTNTILYEQVVELLEKGAQIMIFVHSRRETQSTLEVLKEEASKSETGGLFSAEYEKGYETALQEVQKHAKNKKIVELFKSGFGMHNAGMLRSDRNIVERMFEKGFIKVLCCTATLAWGVNLPAYAVIIKGTQLYDPSKGGFVDLSILDVLQIFGRAGRPQFESQGVGYILTNHEKLNHYVTSVTQQKPIESQLQKTLVDNLNAEICLGSISNLEEAIRWLSYTYLNVRMRKNPFHYGVEPKSLKTDPQLMGRKREIVVDALRRLHHSQMIVFDERSELITPKDLGRIAANYYISQESVMVFNETMTPNMEEADILRLIAKSSEFSHLKVRDDEVSELSKMEKESVHPTTQKPSDTIRAMVSAAKGMGGKNSGGSLTDVTLNDQHARKKGAAGDSYSDKSADTASVEQKVNILMQAYISRSAIDNFSLVSDSMYIAQNGSRIARCLFEVALSRNWGGTAYALLLLCKSIDRRMWDFEQPLMQFDHHKAIVPKVASIGLEIDELRDMSSNDLGNLVRHQKFGHHLKNCVSQFPLVHLEGKVYPITRSVLRVQLQIYQDFNWNNKMHGASEPYWIWVEDGEHNEILYSEFSMLKQGEFQQELSFVIPIIPSKRKNKTNKKLKQITQKKVKKAKPKKEKVARIDSLTDSEDDEDDTEYEDEEEDNYEDNFEKNEDDIDDDDLPNQIYIRAISDRWVACETVLPISFKHLILPYGDRSPHTDLLNLNPLPVAALKDPVLEYICEQRFKYFNPIQTQIFHTLYHTRYNCLVGAPTGSGKTVCAELAMWASFRDYPKSKVVYIAPLKALVKERMLDWNKRLVGPMGRKVIELTGDVAPDIKSIEGADIIITTPEKWDGVSRSWKTRKYVKDVSLVVIDEIHLLGSERGPTLEVIVSRMNLISKTTKQDIRVVGVSTALANANDLGDWLGIGNVGLFNFRHSVRPVPLEIYIDGFPGKHYCPRMGTMNKPAFSAIKTHSPTQPVIIFVSSRRQTRLTAQGLISLCALEEEPRRFLKVTDNDELESILSQVSDQALKDAIGFGIGLHHAGLIESDRKIVESLFVDGKIQVLVATSTLAWGVNYPAHLVIVKGTEYFDADTETYVDFPITDVLQMIGRAGRPQFDNSGVARVFVQDIKKNFYKKFLHEPFPVESSLHLYLEDHINAEVCGGLINGYDKARDWLRWTYLFRRISMNPSYYGLQGTDDRSVQEWMDYRIGLAFRRLQKSKCISVKVNKITFNPSKSSVTETDAFEVKMTRFGDISAYYYLQYQSIGRFLTGLKYIVQERQKILYNEAGEQEGETLDFDGLEYASDSEDDEIWNETPQKLSETLARTSKESKNGKSRRNQKSSSAHDDEFGNTGTLPKSCALEATKENPFGGLPNIIFAWSHSTEYARLPVRHNEDLQNREIAIQLGSTLMNNVDKKLIRFCNALSKLSKGVKILRIASDANTLIGRSNNDEKDANEQTASSSDKNLLSKSSDKVDFLSAYNKAYVLIETYIARRTKDLFTSSDYKTDLSSVLDQSVRIVQAMIDVVVELSVDKDRNGDKSRVYREYQMMGGLPSVLMGLILFLQSIRQARWPLAVVKQQDNPVDENDDWIVYKNIRGWDTLNGYEKFVGNKEGQLEHNDSVSLRTALRCKMATRLAKDVSTINDKTRQEQISAVISETDQFLKRPFVRRLTTLTGSTAEHLNALPVIALDVSPAKAPEIKGRIDNTGLQGSKKIYEITETKEIEPRVHQWAVSSDSLKSKKDKEKPIISASHITETKSLELNVDISRLNATTRSGAEASHFPRSVPEAWFVVIFSVPKEHIQQMTGKSNMSKRSSRIGDTLQESLWTYLKSNGDESSRKGKEIQVSGMKRSVWSAGKREQKKSSVKIEVNLTETQVRGNSLIVGVFSDSYIALDEFAVVTLA